MGQATRELLSECPGTVGLPVSARDCDVLVDAIVEAVDIGRYTSVERVRHALEPFGLVEAFDAELRLNGVTSVCDVEYCGVL